MSRRVAQGFRILGGGRAGGGLTAGNDAAVRAGRAAGRGLIYGAAQPASRAARSTADPPR